MFGVCLQNIPLQQLLLQDMKIARSSSPWEEQILSGLIGLQPKAVTEHLSLMRSLRLIYLKSSWIILADHQTECCSTLQKITLTTIIDKFCDWYHPNCPVFVIESFVSIASGMDNFLHVDSLEQTATFSWRYIYRQKQTVE